MNLTEAFTLRVAIPEPVDYGDTPWGPRIFVGARGGRVEGLFLLGVGVMDTRV